MPTSFPDAYLFPQLNTNRRKLWRSNAYTGGMAYSFHIFVQCGISGPDFSERQAEA
jgi:hypothetical protein